MAYPEPYKIPYDPWFDYNIPAAISDTLQCWIATENTAKWKENAKKIRLQAIWTSSLDKQSSCSGPAECARPSLSLIHI